MNEEDVIQLCIKHRISVSQYYFMWMVLNKTEWTKPFDESLVKQYLTNCGVFPDSDVQKLVDRGMIMNMNAPGHSEVNFYVVADEIAEELIVSEDMAEELWTSYPPTFPLSSGGYFIARGGADKDDILREYRRRIRNSPKRHRFVMAQLERYTRLVNEGRTNGRKLVDFVREEVWDTIAAIPLAGEAGSFAKDI